MATSGNVQLQVVGLQGNTIAEVPVNLDELMAKHSRSVDLGQGIHVTLGQEEEYADDDWAVIDDLKKANAMASASAPVGNGKVNPSEWTSVAPPSDSKVDYSKLEPLDITPSARKFHPLPLAFHSMCSYTDGASASRFIVYGGRTLTEEKNEVYEFSLATSSWRRIEAQHPQCNGVFAHSAVIDSTMLYTLGGFGAGGTPISKAALNGQAEAKRYELIVSESHKAPSAPHTFGILPLLQQLDLRKFIWKRMPLGHQLHVAAHTTVAYNGTLYTFGGVDEKMHVSGNLTAINPKTGEVRLLRREGPAPKPRCLHSAVVYFEWMIVYGGSDANNEVLGDVWAFNFTTEAWEELPAVGGEERMGHGCCLIGSRMLVMGGYGGWIDDEGAKPLTSFIELSLSPIKEQFLWRALKVTAALPNGAAFGAVTSTGSGTSFMSFGGLVLKGASATHHEDELNHSMHSSVNSSVNNTPRGKKSAAKSHASASNPLSPTGAVVLVRFRDKVRQRSASVAKKETLSGDPNELPATTKAFLRRQADFIIKKDFQADQIEKQRSLSIKESADANLYLQPEEVQEIIDSVNGALDQLSNYDFASLPEITPDRAKRIAHIDDSKGLLRQARDVLNSMVPKSTAGHVKSKSHRKMEGAPEEHGGAKPFRRVVVMALVNQVRGHLSALNKLTFGNFTWDKKEEYISFAKECETAVNKFVGTMATIRNKYIQQRLKSIEDNSKRHETIMSRLKAKIEASRTNMKPIQSTFKGKMERDFEVTLDKASVKHWKEVIGKAVDVLQMLHKRCDKETVPAPNAEGQLTSFLYKHVVDSSKIVMSSVSAMLDDLNSFRSSELPEEEVDTKAHYRRFATLEEKINSNLTNIGGQIKVLKGLALTAAGEPTKADKEAGAYRDGFIKQCSKSVNACRSVIQTISASFLSYVPPKKRFEDPHSHAPVINAKRANSKAPAVAQYLPQEERQVVALPKDSLTNYRQPVATIVAPASQAPIPIVAALAEPLHTSFDADSSQLRMPTWTSPFPVINGSAPPVDGKAQAQAFSDFGDAQFDFYRPLRASANVSCIEETKKVTTPPLATYEGPPVPSLPVPIIALHKETVPAAAELPPPPPASSSLPSHSEPLLPGPASTNAVSSTDAFNPYTSQPASQPTSQTFPAQIFTHVYAATQPYYTANMSASRPHTPADCPCTPFNPEYSKDRGMFRGRLTPGERAILTSRQQNTMW